MKKTKNGGGKRRKPKKKSHPIIGESLLKMREDPLIQEWLIRWFPDETK